MEKRKIKRSPIQMSRLADDHFWNEFWRIKRENPGMDIQSARRQAIIALTRCDKLMVIPCYPNVRKAVITRNGIPPPPDASPVLKNDIPKENVGQSLPMVEGVDPGTL